ncbi:tRNA-splicing endonuclease subunit Sen54 isoform 2-T2 [Leptodactylus fuscus]|uniref:tRNA-splicing endonuclease subunit Sen54 isoform X2 n=1 Tax=Leptodactylus fuscus TaxID=238119 RepID=UPI003F4E46F1
MLSPAELFSVRSREQSLPQRSHGQKDFLPDGSQIQMERLQMCRAEQWELLREERVERLGSLGRGIWKPEEELVELMLPAGKFWQTMGFTEGGRQCLLPEEAVYLLECGSVQLLYRDVPMSVQEAYERLLCPGPVSLLHYQVYSHLKRLGYIVTRFDSSLESQSGLKTPENNSKAESKASKPRIGHGPETVPTFAQEPVTLVPVVVENVNVYNEAKNNSWASSKVMCLDEETKGSPLTSQRNYRWDFSKICFPNCAHDHPCLQLPEPEPAFLPDNVIAHQLDISPWLGKLNLRQEKFSRKEQEQLDWERKYKISINADPKIRSCSNWGEYKKLLQERASQSHRERPAHLWSSTVKPLLTPGHVKSTASVLEHITVIGQSTLLEDGNRVRNAPNIPQIDFNLYQADGNKEYKKSKPGKPFAHLCVRSFDEKIPSLQTMKALAYQSGDVPLVFALVDCGEISFYAFKDFQLPVDVHP